MSHIGEDKSNNSQIILKWLRKRQILHFFAIICSLKNLSDFGVIRSINHSSYKKGEDL